MCDEGESETSNQRKKRGKFVKKMNKNVIKMLQLREIRGCVQTHQHGPNLHLMPEVPQRLKFRLCDLISESIQRFGHIFLGFTKDGHHVLSYSMQMDLYLPPTFNYCLYWWRFRPNQPLKKVAEVKIFGEEDISSDLLINVCQWPSDDSKLVIYGVNQESRGHQGPCYLTIAANPPLESCDDCKESCRRLHGDDVDILDEMSDEAWENGQSPLCLRHGFVLHLQFNLVPPFPEFNPLVSLQRDGQIVINTGDSIVALSVSTETKIQPNNSVECSIASPPNVMLTDIADSSYSLSLSSPNNRLHSDDDSPSFEWLQVAKVTLLGKPKTEDQSDLYKLPPAMTSSIVDDRLPNTSCNVCSTDSQGLLSKPTNSEESECVDCELRTELKLDLKSSRRLQEPTASSSSSGIATNFEVLMYSLKPSDDCGVGAFQSVKDMSSDKESVKENVAPDNDINLYKVQQQQGKETRGLNTCNRLGNDCSPLPPSSPPSPDILQRLQQQPSCVMRVKRVFVPRQRDVAADDVEEEDDAGNWVYHGSLPLEVHWPSGTPLVPCPRSLLDEVSGPTLVARQAIFDVEQYLHEMAEQLCTEAGKKFLVFDDYDIEIVDVLSETSDVIVLATMIVQATPKNGLSNSHNQNLSLSPRKQYETGFTFVWSVETGKYEVVDTETFKQVDVSKVKRGVQSGWNPGKKQCVELQTKWRVPRCRNDQVAVLTNETIFTGVSLKEIISPSGDVTIVL